MYNLHCIYTVMQNKMRTSKPEKRRYRFQRVQCNDGTSRKTKNKCHGRIVHHRYPVGIYS